nr:immunoglobulin heavy chain junction region [Macaca mulatta]MOW20535.1 immunoglobulin heavy chain junction region [Macaca mulatta]MOW21260.1 immunoglobulin heavy chain junction region [Macaca mulatta]MOW21425.1 immunoglobulin heavy chain junction region [Macaca mulatta]MOW21700.1 immunoglobulin heavy chain junction region [Macaca mulatta]
CARYPALLEWLLPRFDFW